MALTRTHDRLRLASLDGSLKRRGEVLHLISGRHIHRDLLPRLRGETLEVVVEAARAYIVAVSITRLGVCVCVWAARWRLQRTHKCLAVATDLRKGSFPAPRSTMPCSAGM
eukprot:COSAG01_NODE_4896_length_4645_cov_2.519798_3_plen_111_part_00